MVRIENLNYESRVPPTQPASPTDPGFSADVATLLNLLSLLGGAFLSIYLWLGITDRGGGCGNWAALGALLLGYLIVPIQLLLLMASFSLATRHPPGPANPRRRFALWTMPIGLAVPVLTAVAAGIAVSLP